MPVLTREELHKLVWSMPMNQAAASVAMSGMGLRKICRRHDIPTPPVGYWERLHSVRPSPKIPLPFRDRSPRIELRGVPKKEPRAEILAGRAKAIAELRKEPLPPTTKERWHPCTKRTEKA
jgi:hypothetical protein